MIYGKWPRRRQSYQPARLSANPCIIAALELSALGAYARSFTARFLYFKMMMRWGQNSHVYFCDVLLIEDDYGIEICYTKKVKTI